VRRPTFFGLDFNGADALFHLVAVVFLLVLLLVWRSARPRMAARSSGCARTNAACAPWAMTRGRLKALGLVVAGAIAGVGGALQAYSIRFVSTNDVGVARSVEAFVSVLIGGASTLLGPVVGAMVVLFVERVMPSYIAFAKRCWAFSSFIFVLAARQGIVRSGSRGVRAGRA